MIAETNNGINILGIPSWFKQDRNIYHSPQNMSQYVLVLCAGSPFRRDSHRTCSNFPVEIQDIKDHAMDHATNMDVD